MNARIVKRIAMWSGPRNISTAMMRAWENREDCVVIDEPFYAHYLKETGIDHPGREEVLAGQENDWQKVVEELLGPVPEDKEIFYQKHMTHHLLPGMGRSWLDNLAHAFLIRDPLEVVASYVQKREEVTPKDIGVHQQAEIFQFIESIFAAAPPVIDAKDVLMNPERSLKALCSAIRVPFDKDMLSWPPGRRESDGVWASYWYANVEKSTGFQPYEPKTVEISDELRAVAAACEEPYQYLWKRRIKI